MQRATSRSDLFPRLVTMQKAINARHFGDLGDPASPVSLLVAERDGVDLMPEQGTRPVNKYLPPRARKPLADSAPSLPLAENTDGAKGFFAWLDGMLDRI